MADPENNVADTSTGGGDVVITDRELFDHAISDTPAIPASPAPASAREDGRSPDGDQHPQPTEQPGTTPRDPQGRFAPKPPQQATTQQPDQPPKPPQQQQRQPEDNRVPVATLLQERERAYRAEAELNQMRQAWAQFQAQQQAVAQQQQTPQTIWDAPDDYINQRVVAPLRQEMQLEMMRRTDLQSREFANEQFGEQTVNAALQDIGRIRQTPQGEFVFNQIMAAGHPYGALVKWHRTATAQQSIGSDPQAWLQQKQQEWVKDPKAQQAVLQYIRQQQQAAGRPPNVSLPPSLSSLPASSGRLDDEGDLSNESLYRYATK